ncbi:ABC transporter ATP-binding protein [Pontibacter silvestris]|uniref:ABC transporter ATP-binding protein n=1 Tax=Pontibacter silvestris TaxID=2305183 RepID=A0ABW4WY99_9BACT|nr:ABC transporter ATP-binding protein [Pontibacter silvestris]MCC9137346.1 ABC transporter ATP-binding protein [Pontibacter silvestris]
MSDIAIKVEDLSKQYRLGVVGTGTLAHDLNRWWHRVRGNEDPYLKIGETNDRATKGSSEYVWALKDINFEVKQGEVLGIVGKNGAGKSTLLKLLSRVTSPTTGTIKAKGRIASLLEVGTGFHEELTGRENVFLNGAIMGMTKAEVRAKFDEIVAFSGTERYIDTPVKRYSSGMRVRLAFAVAAHLDPEILIVDEVLAVGDAEFQKKAIGKMQEVAKGGERTVLFVSHNMASMLNLCDNGLFMKDGQIYEQSTIKNIVDLYLKDNESLFSTSCLKDRIDRKGNQLVTYTEVKFLDENYTPVTTLLNGHKVIIELSFMRKKTLETLKKVHFSIGVNDSMDNRILLLSTDLTQQTFSSLPPEVNKVYIEVPKLQLREGAYSFTLNMRVMGETVDWVPNAGSFNVVNGDFFCTGASLPEGQGYFLVDHSFTIH